MTYSKSDPVQDIHNPRRIYPQRNPKEKSLSHTIRLFKGIVHPKINVLTLRLFQTFISLLNTLKKIL